VRRLALLVPLVTACGGPLQVLEPPPNPFADHDLVVTESTCPGLGDRCDQLLRLSFDLPPVVLVPAETGELQFLQDSVVAGDRETVVYTRRHTDAGGSVASSVEAVVSLRDHPQRRPLAEGGEPDVSRDGTRVVYTRPDDGGLDVVGIDGTALQQVISAGNEAHGARFSPDGTEVAFIARSDRRLWHMKLADGTAVEYGDVRGVQELAWAPSGTWLLVATDAGVFLMDRDARNLVPRVRLAGSSFLWSGDGLALAFLGGTQDGRAQLVVSEPAGAAPRALTDRVVWGRFSWSPADDWLAYSSGTTTWAVRLQDGKAVAVHESEGAQRDPLWVR
jgi:WD40 repeat protein